MAGRRLLRLMAVGVVWWLAAPSPAAAQSTDPPAIASQTSGRGRWELEGYGGFSSLRVPTGGSSSLPSPGAPITTSSPIFPSRQVSSWFLGDGTVLLNEVNAQLAVPQRVTPLDAALGSLGLARGPNAAFGLHVRRRMSSRLSAQIGLDVMTGSRDLPDEVIAAVATTEASFKTALGALLATGPFTNVLVEASSTAAKAPSTELAVTGAARVRLATFGSFETYATLGAGAIFEAGQSSSATLVGHYRFTILGTVPIDETDRVTIRQEQALAVIGVLGAGVRRALSDRWGFSIDGRWLAGRQGTQLVIDAKPVVAGGTPAGFIESFSYPSIQFSNATSTGRQSTLSGPALDGFAVFKSSGLQSRFVVTLGVFARF